jgi:hypothetical protein
MAPPLPPPGVPAWAGLAPSPMARLPVKVLPVISTGRLAYWLSARMAAPPRSGPVESQRLPVKRASMTLSWPPRSKMAPPPPAVVDLPGGVAVGEGDVLHGQGGSGLVLDYIQVGPAGCSVRESQYGKSPA